ncbi:MAG: hypothetical protein JNN04_16555, partial [Cyclobacteriaceae bacterium]|nr:hypothetical protein [Cyclobacteriaceae bacterium]
MNYEVDPLYRKQANTIRHIEDHKDHLIMTTAFGLWEFDKTRKEFRRPKAAPRDTAILFSHGLWWIKPYTYLLDPKKPEDPVIEVSTDSGYLITRRAVFPNLIFRGIDQDPDGIYWIGTSNGLYRFDPSTEYCQRVETRSGFIEDICVDRESNVWYATREGIGRFNPNSLPYSTQQIEFEGASEYSINDIIFTYPHSNEVVVVGGSNKYSNPIWTGQITSKGIDLKIFDFYGRKEIKSNLIKSWRGRDRLWVATWGRGVLGFPISSLSGKLMPANVAFYRHDSLSAYTLADDRTWAIFEDSTGVVWSGTTAGLSRIDPRLKYGSEGSVQNFKSTAGDTSSLSFNFVRHIVPNDNGSIWVATEIGVDLFREGKFQHVFKNRERVDGLLRSSDGSLYVATDGGLYKNDKDSDNTMFTNVLNSEMVSKMVEDTLGRLWLASSRGLSVFDPKRGLHFKLYDNPDFSIVGSLTMGDSGLLVIGSRNKIHTINSADFMFSEAAVTPLFTNLAVNNVPAVILGHPARPDDFLIPASITVLESITLDYLHNNFALEFSAMEMTAPEKNLYRHKLEGYDQDWIETDHRNRAGTYTNLPAGTYTFRVKASNHHGVWSDDERTLKVIILPPPWRTWWAYTGYSLLAAALLV